MGLKFPSTKMPFIPVFRERKKDIKLQWFPFLGRNGRILSQHKFVNPLKALLLMHQQP